MRIIFLSLRYGLTDLLISSFEHPLISFFLKSFISKKNLKFSKEKRLRLALEVMGPIFVKFGQLLSTRKDLISSELSNELESLQDNVTPFPSSESIESIEKALGCSIDFLFSKFESIPVASASIAQVHFAELYDGRKVAVKVLRPNVRDIIEKDLALLKLVSQIVEIFGNDTRRLKPRAIVDEFDKYLHNELDLVKEASNCSQLRRNFSNGYDRKNMLMVPKVIWEYTRSTVFTMQRMYGIPIGQVDKLRLSGIDIPTLACLGVEVFFTQVFSDGFFHADMHPGNIYVSNNPETLGRYIALDFGIVGSLSEFDKNYLAQNFLAFFHRDYRRVAQLHIECGWVPPNTREEELEGAIRSVCEPYFDRALSEISLGQILLRLFQVSRDFNIEIQPQLVLLQKTLLNVEGLGRQLDPNLDLWKTAKPYLEKWTREQVGLGSLCHAIRKESRQWGRILPALPRLIHENLECKNLNSYLLQEISRLQYSYQKFNRFMIFVLLIFAGIILFMNISIWNFL